MYRRKNRERYYSLRKGGSSLMGKIGEIEPGALVAQVEYTGKTGDQKYYFEHFTSFGEFFDHYGGIQKPERHYYEVILPESYRKPYFDIDFKIPKEEIGERIQDLQDFLSALVDGISAVFSECGVELDVGKDVIILDSTGPASTGMVKVSLHVIVHNWYLRSAEESGEFFRRTITHMDPKWEEWVDASVYSRGRCFRILGSRKVGTTRMLRHLDEWMHHGDLTKSPYSGVGERKDRIRLFVSLITTTSNCRAFPKLSLPLKSHQHDNTQPGPAPTSGEVSDAMEVLETYLAGEGGLVRGKVPFAFRETAGAIVALKRLAPSYCAMCSRTHGEGGKGDNPYLAISKGRVYYHCRRAKDSSYIGDIPEEEETVDEKASIAEEFTKPVKEKGLPVGDGGPSASAPLVPMDLGLLDQLERVSEERVKRSAVIKNIV